jgi:serine/threonine protein kinase
MASGRRHPIDAAAPPALRDLLVGLRGLVDSRFGSLRELEKAAHVSRSTLSDALSGRRLPGQDVLTAIVRACGGNEPAWRERWLSTRATLAAEAHGPVDQVAANGVSTPPAPAPQLVLTALRDTDPRRVGPLRVLGVLGSGTTGRVYLAHTPGRRPVAVKVVHPEFADDREFRRRFRREVDAARKVHGLCTAQVVDADPGAPRPWLATAYVPGPSLHHAVTEHGPLPAATVRQLAAGIGEALRAIHAVGIVHRDLTPTNVLLAADGPKVIDFGLAHTTEASHLTHTGARLGTAAFMAPEQALGKRVGPAADVYALGAVLAFAATGSPPHGDGPAEAVLYRVVHEPPDLDRIDDDELREVIADCLVKDAEKRLGLDQVLARLAPAVSTTAALWLPAAVAADLPRHALPARLSVRRRRPRLAYAAATAIAVVLTGGVLTQADLPHLTPPSAAHDSTAPTTTTHAPSAGAAGSSAPSTTTRTGTSPAAMAGGSAAGGSGVGVGGLAAPQTQTSHGVATAADAGPRPAATAPTTSYRMSFETGRENWGVFWGNHTHVTTTDQTAYAGSHSLLVQVDASDGAQAVGTDAVGGLGAGSTVTLHVWYGGQGQGAVRPFVQDTDYAEHVQAPRALRATGWTTVSFTVPDVSVKGIGVQIDDTGGGSLVVALDAVTW